MEYDRVSGRYLDPTQPVQTGSVLDASVRPPNIPPPQLQIASEPSMVLQPNAPANGQSQQFTFAAEGRRKDADEVTYDDLEPRPTDQIKRYVNGGVF